MKYNTNHHAQSESGFEAQQNETNIFAQKKEQFIMQLQTGRKNHRAAKKYFECLVSEQTRLDQELGYRLDYRSPIAVNWIRQLSSKWLALLAHYVTDVELKHLPKPMVEDLVYEEIHRYYPLSDVYAEMLITTRSINLSLKESIYRMRHAQIDDQDDDALLATSQMFYEEVKMLQLVCTAQIDLIDIWLNPSVSMHVNNFISLSSAQAEIYGDFYDLDLIVSSPDLLMSILNEFHARHAAGIPYLPTECFPPFSEFKKFLLSGRKR